jgi:hypothetical protein
MLQWPEAMDRLNGHVFIFRIQKAGSNKTIKHGACPSKL